MQIVVESVCYTKNVWRPSMYCKLDLIVCEWMDILAALLLPGPVPLSTFWVVFRVKEPSSLEW